MTSPLPSTTDPAPLLVASVDELRVLATLAGSELPPVLDADPGPDGRTLADLVAVRSLLARGWFSIDDADGTAAPSAEVRQALGAAADLSSLAEAVVEVEVVADDELVRQALVLGPAGDRLLAETHLGVWTVAEVPADVVGRFDHLVSAPPATEPRDPSGDRPRQRVLDRDEELLAGGREVLVRVARRLDADRFTAEEHHWVVGPGGRWAVEAAEADLDEDDAEEVAVAVTADDLDDLVVAALASVADVLGVGARS